MLITDSIWSLQENIIYDARREKVYFVSRESQCFPRLPHSSDDLLYSWKFWSWKFIKPRWNGTRRSTFAGNSALLPSNVVEFCKCYRLRDFGGKQFHWYMSCDSEATNESASCWEKNCFSHQKFGMDNIKERQQWTREC